jgi:metal-responsive CopG/Arc/MetJ family transcriptional regulator
VKTIQMTLDENLVREVDQAVKRLRTTRSAFTRKALREALRRLAAAGQERQHRRGYEAQPVKRSEFSVWEKEQEWGDE